MPENKKKILIVEDDSTLSSMYKTKFELDGFEVVAMANGAEGLEAARKDRFDIIFLDVILPQLDGFAVLEEIKKDPKIKNIPVVMLTNLGTQEDMDKGKKMGAVDYIVKASLTPSQVSDKIKEYIK